MSENTPLYPRTSLNTLYETLLRSQSAANHLYKGRPESMVMVTTLQDLIDQIKVYRPIGPDGKHGSLHTPFCGCPDAPKQAPPPPTPRYLPNGARRLTERELQIVKIIAKGQTNKQIAAQLTLSPYTVKTHMQRIAEKLNIVDQGRNTRLLIVSEAKKQGYEVE